MKIPVKVCEICRREDCGGRIFLTPEMHGSYGLYVGVLRVCESDPHIFQHDGQWFYRLVSGFGDYHDYALTEIKGEEKS